MKMLYSVIVQKKKSSGDTTDKASGPLTKLTPGEGNEMFAGFTKGSKETS